MTGTVKPAPADFQPATAEQCAHWCYVQADRAAGDPESDCWHTPDECTSEALDTLVGTNTMNPEWDGDDAEETYPGWQAALDTHLQREADGQHTISLVLGRVQPATGTHCMEGDHIDLALPDAVRLRDQLTTRIELAEADTEALRAAVASVKSRRTT